MGEERPKRIDRMGPQSGRVLLSGEKIGNDLAFVFAGGSAADTQVVQTVNAPSEAGGVTRFDPVQAYKIAIHNPGASPLTIKLMTVEENLGGADRDCLLDTLAVPASATVTGTAVNAYEFLTGGIFCGGDLKVVVSNDDAIGEAAGFTATIRIREV